MGGTRGANVPAVAGKPNVPALQAERGGGRGTELVERSDILITRVQVDGRAGGFKWVSTGATRQTITFTPIFFYKTRIFFGDQEKGDPVVLCRSTNAIFPTDWDGDGLSRYGLDNPAPECGEKVCPFNKWSKDDQGKVVPPQCRLQYNFLGYIAETAEIAVLTVHGSSIVAARNITSDGAKSSHDFWVKTYTLGTKKGGQGSMTFHMLEIVGVEDTTPVETMSAYEAIYNDVVGDNPRRAAEMLAGGKGEGGGGDRSAARAAGEDAPPVTPGEEEVPF